MRALGQVMVPGKHLVKCEVDEATLEASVAEARADDDLCDQVSKARIAVSIAGGGAPEG